MNSDHLTVKENSNVTVDEALMLAGFNIIYYILIPASKSPEEFTKFSRIEKQEPTDKSVLLTAENIHFLYNGMFGAELTIEQIEKILELAFNSGMLTRRWETGKPKNYKFVLFQKFANEI